MKRFFIFFACLITICGLVFFLLKGSERQLAPVDLLPGDTAMMLDFVDPEAAMLRFQSSRLGKKLAGIQWVKVLRALEVPEEEIVLLQEEYKEVCELVDNPLFREVFGRRVTLALLPGGQDEYGVRQDILRDLVLIARPKHNAALLDELFSRFAGGVEFTSAPYRGVTVKTFALEPNLSVSTAITNGLLVASLSPRVVERSLDRALDASPDEGSTGLAHYGQYKSARAGAGGREDFFGYVNIPRLQPLIELFARTAGNEPEKEFYQRLFGTGLDTLVFFREPGVELQQYTMIGKLSDDHSGSLRRFFSGAQPVTNSRLDRIPADVVVYYWTNWITFENYWESMLHSPDPREREAAGKMEDKLRQKTDLTVEQLLGLFGSEITLAVNDFSATGFFPMLRVAACVAIDDPEGVENLMEKVVEGLPVQRAVINEVPVVTVMAVNGLMQPSYAILDNCLILADSREQVDSFLRAEQNPLMNDPDFKQVNMTADAPNNMMVFARLNRIYAGLRELSTWLGSIAALRDKRQGERVRVIVEQLVLPVLDGLEMYRVKGSRGVSGDNELILRTAVIVEQEGAKSASQ